MTEYMNDASSEREREAYSAPNYERFAFETTGLMQASEDILGGNIGDATKHRSNAAGEFGY